MARDIIVIGASAGGVEALSALVAKLPHDLAASVFVTIHFPTQAISVLPQILRRAGSMPAAHPADGERILPGHVYVAPPDRHLLLYRGLIRVIRGPAENGHRPAIDPMFRSAAVAYGSRVIGIVLTGNLDDGTAGLLAIKRREGIAIAQSPSEAAFPSMPLSAVQNVPLDFVLPIAEMPSALRELVTGNSGGAIPEASSADIRENALHAFDLAMIERPDAHPGDPSPYGCPDCGGVLWQIRDGNMVRFRCRVGHGWTSEALLERQDATLEAALWSSLRALEESAALADQMAGRFEKRGQGELAARYRESAARGRERAGVIRDALVAPRDHFTDDPASAVGVTVRSSGKKA